MRFAPARPRSLHDVEPDASAPDHRDGVAGPDAPDVEHRAEAGGDAAAREADDVERDVVGDLDHLGLAHDGLLREGARAHERVDRLAGLVEPRRPVGHAAGDRGDASLAVAVHEVSGQAVVALEAGPVERDHDVVTRRDGRDARADGLDDARALVTEHARERGDGGAAVEHVQVGAADAGGRDPHEHLAGARLVDVDVLECRARCDVVYDDGLHPFPLRSTGSLASNKCLNYGRTSSASRGRRASRSSAGRGSASERPARRSEPCATA